MELLRQSIDYKGWYDKAKVQFKMVHPVQYLAAMNPTAGCYTITPRMQRHFATFAVHMPSMDSIRCVVLVLAFLMCAIDSWIVSMPCPNGAQVNIDHIVDRSFGFLRP